MIPFLLAALGGYLIGDSIGKDIDKKIPEFADGGVIGQDGKLLKIGDLVSVSSKRNKIYSVKEINGNDVKVVYHDGSEYITPASDLKKFVWVSDRMAKGGSIGVDKASNGFKKKFVWVKEQNGVATELLQQKSFEEDFKELSNSSRFKLIRDDKGMKVFDDNVAWRITYRLKPIFAYGGQLELDFEPEEQIDESTLKARRYVELQNLANEQIELFGEIEDDTMRDIEELGESLNSHEVELVMEMYNKKKFAKGGLLNRKMYVVEIYSIESDDEGDDDMDLEKYTLRVAATDERDAIDSAESVFVEEYGAMPIFSTKVVNSFDDGGNVGDVKLSDYNPRIHDEEITILNLGSDYARVEFNLVYADNAMVSYLLDYDIDRREYDWQLEKVYKIEDGKMVEEYLHWSPEFKAIQSNKFLIEAVDDKIGEALNN